MKAGERELAERRFIMLFVCLLLLINILGLNGVDTFQTNEILIGAWSIIHRHRPYDQHLSYLP